MLHVFQISPFGLLFAKGTVNMNDRVMENLTECQIQKYFLPEGTYLCQCHIVPWG